MQTSGDAAAAAGLPPMVWLVFSRSPLGNAVNCPAGSQPGHQLAGSELASRGLAAVGTAETRAVGETVRPCYHYRSTIAMSWADIAHYRDGYGWGFISRTRGELPTLGNAQLEQEVAGSLRDLESRDHLRASGMYAYQNNIYDNRTQTVVRRYYKFGR